MYTSNSPSSSWARTAVATALGGQALHALVELGVGLVERLVAR